MPTIHMTETEVNGNFSVVLEKIGRGIEIVVDQNQRPVAVIRSLGRAGRPISECIASAHARASKVTLDPGFAQDVESGIKDLQKPWTPPSWD
jgi:antitoxin (DNA-binding transcriptional repressor) of toxin-antitoxin stability system